MQELFKAIVERFISNGEILGITYSFHQDEKSLEIRHRGDISEFRDEFFLLLITDEGDNSVSLYSFHWRNREFSPAPIAARIRFAEGLREDGKKDIFFDSASRIFSDPEGFTNIGVPRCV